MRRGSPRMIRTPRSRCSNGSATTPRGKAAKSEKKFLALERIYPRAASPGTGVGYARLRAQHNDAALSAFVAVLERHPSYAPALIGAATAARTASDISPS